jgi:hypothetical protein
MEKMHDSLSKLRRLLGKASEQDRKIILLMAQKMAQKMALR